MIWGSGTSNCRGPRYTAAALDDERLVPLLMASRRMIFRRRPRPVRTRRFGAVASDRRSVAGRTAAADLTPPNVGSNRVRSTSSAVLSLAQASVGSLR